MGKKRVRRASEILKEGTISSHKTTFEPIRSLTRFYCRLHNFVKLNFFLRELT